MYKNILLLCAMPLAIGALAQKPSLKKTAKLPVLHTTYKNEKHTIKVAGQDNRHWLALSKQLHASSGLAMYYANNSNQKEASAGSTAIEKNREQFQKNNNFTKYTESSIELVKYYILTKQYNKSTSVINECITYLLSKKEYINIIRFYIVLSEISTGKGDYLEAISYCKKAILYCYTINNKEQESKTYHQLSIIYANLEEYPKALDYIDQSIALAITTKDKNILSITKVRVLCQLNQYATALRLSKQNDLFFKKNNLQDKPFYSRHLLRLSESYLYNNKYKEALSCLNQILKAPALITPLKVKVYINLSNTYLALKNNTLALLYSNKAVDLINATRNNKEKIDVYLSKSKAESVVGNYKMALSYRTMADSLKTINSIKINRDKLLQMQVDFGILQKDEKIKLLRANEISRSLQLKKQRQSLTVISILFVIAFFSILFFIRANKAIKIKNKIIKRNNSALEKAQSLFKKSIAEKEILLKEIHHRVKNNMQLVISLLKIQSLDVKQLTIEEFITVSEARIMSMILIHENLYQSDTINKVDFKEYLNNLSQFITNSYTGFKNVRLKMCTDPIYFDIQTAIPIGLIINELINNAYKHAFQNKDDGNILLHLTDNQGNYELIIHDDGIGISNNPTNQKGLGMELVQLLVSQIKGFLKTDSINGTTFTIQFQNIIT